MSKIKYLYFFILLFFPIWVFALEYPVNHYANAIIYDLTDDKTLYKLNANQKTSVASLTKILTVITDIENIKDFNNNPIGLINYYYQDNLIATEPVYINLDTYKNELIILTFLAFLF